MYRLVAKNGFVNLLQFMFSAAMVFVMTPIYVHSLGDYDYGIWQVIGALMGYTNILDLGMQPTIARYVARAAAGRQHEALAHLFMTSLAMLVAFAALPAIAFVVWGVFLPEALVHGTAELAKYRLVLVLAGASVLLTFMRFVFVSFLEGMQRYASRTLVNVLHTLVFAVVFVAYRQRFDPLGLMMVLSVALAVSRLVFLAIMVKRHLPAGVRLSRGTFERDLARELFGFGGKSFIQNMATTIEGRTSTLIIGALSGPASVVFFSLPQSLGLYIRNLGWTLSHAFMPAFSELSATESGSARLTQLFLGGSRHVLAATLPLALGVALLGTDFLALWVGQKYAEGSTVLIAIICGYYLGGLLTPLDSRYLTALGQHGLLARLYPARAVANVVLSLALLPLLGLPGVALGALVPELVVRVPVLIGLVQRLGISVGEFARAVWWPQLPPALGMALVLVAFRHGDGTMGWHELIGAAVASTLVFFGLYFFTGTTPEERGAMRRLLFKRAV